MFLKVGIKGKILEGTYSPTGEVIIVDYTEKTGGFYIYIWPNNGETWPDSNKKIVYDTWYEHFQNVENHFRNNKWAIKWDH